MAKTHTHHRTAITPYRHPAPRTIVVRAAAPVTRHKKGKHHRGKSMSSEKVLMGLAMGGLAMGFLDKPGGIASNLPTIPILGKAGTIAVIAHFIAKNQRGGIAVDIRNAAAVVAAYEFGLKGSVSGDE